MSETYNIAIVRYQILRAIAQLKDNPESVDSVVAQLQAFLSQTQNEIPSNIKEMDEELKTVQIELQRLGRMMTGCPDEAKNQQMAILQHITRLREEIK